MGLLLPSMPFGHGSGFRARFLLSGLRLAGYDTSLLARTAWDWDWRQPHSGAGGAAGKQWKRTEVARQLIIPDRPGKADRGRHQCGASGRPADGAVTADGELPSFGSATERMTQFPLASNKWEGVARFAQTTAMKEPSAKKPRMGNREGRAPAL